MLSLTLLILGVGFLLLYLYRELTNIGVDVDAEVLECSEAEMELPSRYSSYAYYYPQITYQYVFDGQSFKGSVGKRESRLFRVSKDAALGGDRKDDEYFWRGLSVGDSIPVRVNKNKPQNSQLSGYVNKSYASEKYVFLILALTFIGLGLIT